MIFYGSINEITVELVRSIYGDNHRRDNVSDDEWCSWGPGDICCPLD